MPRAPRCLAERSKWPVAFDRHPTTGSRLGVVVPQRLMLDAAVVPEGYRMRLPTEPALEFLPGAELAQKIEDRTAFLSWQLIDVGGEVAVDIECLAFCHRMRAYDRVRCPRIDLAGLRQAHQRIVAAIDMVARMSRGQAVEIGLHAGRERIIGCVLAGKERIAAA